MSVVFILAPYPASTLRDIATDSTKRIGNLTINPSEYKKSILARWPQAQVQQPTEENIPYFPLHWVLPPSRPNFSGLEGRLYPNLQIVTLGTGPKESFLEFVLWHRSIIPFEYPLYLFDSSSVDSLEVTQDTTEQDIINFTKIID